MSDIVDVIHRFTYNVDESPLVKILNTIDAQTGAIEKQQASLARLEAQFDKTAANELDKRNKLAQAIENRKKAIAGEEQNLLRFIATDEKLQRQLNKEIGLLNQLQAQAIKTGSGMGQLKDHSNSAGLALINVGRVAQDLPFGFIGIQNNLNPLLESFQRLKAETGSTGGALKALASSLGGAGGVGLALSVASSLLLIFGDRLFKSGDEAERSAEKQKKLDDAIKNLNTTLIENIKLTNDQAKALGNARDVGANKLERELKLLEAQGGKEEEVYNKSKELKSKELQDLQNDASRYKAIADNIQRDFDFFNSVSATEGDPKNNKNFVGSVAKTLRENLTGLTEEDAKRRAASYIKNLNTANSIIPKFLEEERKLNEQIKDKTTEIDADKFKFQREQGEKRAQAEKEAKEKNEAAYRTAIQSAEDQFQQAKELDKDLQYLRALSQSNTEVYREMLESDAANGINRSLEDRKAREEQYNKDQKHISDLITIRETQMSGSLAVRQARIADDFGKNADASRFRQKGNELDISLSNQKVNLILSGEIIPTIDTGNSTVDWSELNKAIQKSRRGKGEIKELKADQFLPDKKTIEEKLRDVESVYGSFASAVSDILNGIHDRQIRMLDEELTIRERRVESAKELALRGNTEILRIEEDRLNQTQKKREEFARKQETINAGLALSNAIVAVAVTAAESGVASIGTIPAVIAALAAGYAFVRSLDSSQGFKDGVIDLRGPGTSTSDSIPAKLSVGESVMTARETRQHKNVLKAIRRGTFEDEYVLNPDLAKGHIHNRTAASKADLKTLGDRIVDAIYDNPVNVKQSMDKHEIAQSVERVIIQEQRRWAG